MKKFKISRLRLLDIPVYENVHDKEIRFLYKTTFNNYTIRIVKYKTLDDYYIYIHKQNKFLNYVYTDVLNIEYNFTRNVIYKNLANLYSSLLYKMFEKYDTIDSIDNEFFYDGYLKRRLKND